MYLPAHFAETRVDVLRALMQAHPLATIVTLSSEGLVADHIPLELKEGPDPQGPGVLRGHVARANAMWRDASGCEALVIFQGPQHYFSPGWYPSKKETGKVVPTWNYCCVHAYGHLRVHDDAVWVRELVNGLTARHESRMPRPWSTDDAPAEYVQTLLEQIVGIEICITRITGKWKVSQNQPAHNRAGVIGGLSGLGEPDAHAMAQLIGQHQPPQA